MRVLIVSDTHRHNDNYFRVLEREGQLDMVIHCGDAEGSEYLLQEAAGCPLHIVMGNNDFFSNLPREEELEIAGKKVLVTHGHYYCVSNGYELLKDEGMARGFDIVMYGHTHRPVVDKSDGIVVINPGSLTYPRQEGRRPSYIMMEMNKKGDMDFVVKYL
ncbi:MAG: metallophosphoesterase [Lachnospiraceae bacterium]|nr:metallophosphoesterase [Lachnospiraceae bacterium]